MMFGKQRSKRSKKQKSDVEKSSSFSGIILSGNGALFIVKLIIILTGSLRFYRLRLQYDNRDPSTRSTRSGSLQVMLSRRNAEVKNCFVIVVKL